MRAMLTPFFCIIFILGRASLLWSQVQPVLTDEMIRRLGGDPDKARAVAGKRALEARFAEDILNDQRAFAMSETLTDDSIRQIPSTDPLLLALYRNRIGTGAGVSNEFPWLSIVDRDIRRRPAAAALFQTIFRTTNQYGNRFYVMRWLAGNADVPWGNDLMEEAIKLYRADPSKWESSDVGALCRLVMIRGDESHLDFLDEVNAGIGDGGAGVSLRRRLQASKGKTHTSIEHALPPVWLPNVADSAKIKAVTQDQSSSLQEHSPSTPWSVITVLIVAALGLLWLLLKRRS